MSEIKSNNLIKLFQRAYDSEKAQRLWNATNALRKLVQENNNEVGYCPCCDARVSDKKVSFNKDTVRSIHRIYRWCGEKEKHEFKTSEVKHMMDKTSYANIGHLKKFGGIFYRPTDPETGKTRRGLWGMNMERAKEFFEGKRTAPVQIIKDRFTDKIIASTEKYIGEFPDIREFLQDNGLYDPHYTVSDQDADRKRQATLGRKTVPDYQSEQSSLL